MVKESASLMTEAETAVFRGYRYRLEPDAAMAAGLTSCAGAARWVWNKALERQRERLQSGLPPASYVEMAGWLSEWKAQPSTSWLSSAIAQALQQRLRDLSLAIQVRRTRGSGSKPLPEFQQKRPRTSFRLPQRVRVHSDVNGWTYLQVPKLGPCKMRLSRPLPAAPQNCTVSCDGEHWFASFQVRSSRRRPTQSGALGLDLGVNVSVAASDGSLWTCERREREERPRLASLQRSLSRKQRRSRNWQRCRARLARLSARLANARNDWTHKLTSRLASSARDIVIEDLRVKNMLSSARTSTGRPGGSCAQKRGLNRAIWEQGWYRFRYQLTYKVGEASGAVIAVPPANTSRRCFACGTVDGASRQSIRFTCIACGHEDHADVNAAKNILRAAGHAVFACGDRADSLVIEAGTQAPTGQAGTGSRRFGGRMPIRTRMCSSILSIATSAILLAPAAKAQQARLPVEDFRPLLVKAIESPDGAAFGVLIGPMAEALTTKMKATSPILIDVTTLRRYKQSGCSRLNVRFAQDGVVLPGTDKPRNQTFDLGLNYCRDGQPPKSLA